MDEPKRSTNGRFHATHIPSVKEEGRRCTYVVGVANADVGTSRKGRDGRTCTPTQTTPSTRNRGKDARRSTVACACSRNGSHLVRGRRRCRFLGGGGRRRQPQFAKLARHLLCSTEAQACTPLTTSTTCAFATLPTFFVAAICVLVQTLVPASSIQRRTETIRVHALRAAAGAELLSTSLAAQEVPVAICIGAVDVHGRHHRAAAVIAASRRRFVLIGGQSLVEHVQASLPDLFVVAFAAQVIGNATFQRVQLIEALPFQPGRINVATDATRAVHEDGLSFFRFLQLRERFFHATCCGCFPEHVHRWPGSTVKVSCVPFVPVAHIQQDGLGPFLFLLLDHLFPFGRRQRSSAAGWICYGKFHGSTLEGYEPLFLSYGQPRERVSFAVFHAVSQSTKRRSPFHEIRVGECIFFLPTELGVDALWADVDSSSYVLFRAESTVQFRFVGHVFQIHEVVEIDHGVVTSFLLASTSEVPRAFLRSSSPPRCECTSSHVRCGGVHRSHPPRRRPRRLRHALLHLPCGPWSRSAPGANLTPSVPCDSSRWRRGFPWVRPCETERDSLRDVE